MSKKQRKENLEEFIKNEVLVDSDSHKIYEPEDIKKIIKWVKKQSDQIEAFTSYFNLGDWFYYRAEDTRFSPVAFLEAQLPKEQPSKVNKRGKKENDNTRNMGAKVERQHRASRKLEDTTSTRRTSKNNKVGKSRVVSSKSRSDSKKSTRVQADKKRTTKVQSRKTGQSNKTRGARK